jgi:hypothetical protein
MFLNDARTRQQNETGDLLVGSFNGVSSDILSLQCNYVF